MKSYVSDSKGTGKFKLIALIALVGVFTLFILQNTDVVEIRFLLWRLSISRVLILFGSLLIGVLIGLLLGWEKKSSKL